MLSRKPFKESKIFKARGPIAQPGNDKANAFRPPSLRWEIRALVLYDH
jgi:hypothetical protein